MNKLILTAIFLIFAITGYSQGNPQIPVDTTSADSSAMVLEIEYVHDTLDNVAYRRMIYKRPDGSQMINETPRMSLQQFRDMEKQNLEQLDEQIQFIKDEIKRLRQEYRNAIVTRNEAKRRWNKFKGKLR